MNIHRELAIYRILVLKSHEAHQDRLAALADNQAAGNDAASDPDVLACTRVWQALQQAANEQRDRIVEIVEALKSVDPQP